MSTSEPREISAEECIHKEWFRIRTLARRKQFAALLESCAIFLHIIEEPMLITDKRSEFGRHFLTEFRNPASRRHIWIYMREPHIRLHYLTRLIGLVEQLPAVIIDRNNPVLQASLRQRLDEMQALHIKLSNNPLLTTEGQAWLDQRQAVELATLPKNTADARGCTWVGAAEARTGPGLARFINQTAGSELWMSDAMEQIPGDSQLCVFGMESGRLYRHTYKLRGFSTYIVETSLGPLNPQELSDIIFRLRRELQRGMPLEKVAPLVEWLRKRLQIEPTTPGGTTYWIGFGALTEVPMSLLIPTPTVRLSQRPHFTIQPPAIHYRCGELRGYALWSTKAPEPLTHTKAECQQLPQFIVKPATVDSVLTALRNHNLVHVAAHAEASRHSRMETKLVLQDDYLSVANLETRRFQATLIFLNACETAIESTILGDGGSLAEAFLRGGAGAVVAAKWRIPDDQAMVIAEAFWGWIRAGLNPIQALHKARKELHSPHAHAFELHF